jgi:hypothetical protein
MRIGRALPMLLCVENYKTDSTRELQVSRDLLISGAKLKQVEGRRKARFNAPTSCTSQPKGTEGGAISGQLQCHMNPIHHSKLSVAEVISPGEISVQPFHPTSRKLAVVTESLNTSHSTCINRQRRRSVVFSFNFHSFLSCDPVTPISADHALLTLLHFNLVRALTQNILALGLNPDLMAQDIPSPWCSTPSSDSTLQLSTEPCLSTLPPTLHPTFIQRTIQHHPEIDVFPFPNYRDNVILAGEQIDDIELCHDIIYGVDPTRLATGISCHELPIGARTGLIVWDDPWLQSSWEVEESFARKWKHLFRGCEDLFESTNAWRERRGEARLVD